jgi:glutamate/aspartate transport system substrate-binding protein
MHRTLVSAIALVGATATICHAATTTAAARPAPATADSPTLARIARSGVVNIGYIPTQGTFAFAAPDGSTVGYSIDLCRHVVDDIRHAVGRADLRIVFRPLAPSERIPLLKSGAIDMDCGGNTNTVARQRDVDFSFTFFTTGVRFLVKRPLTLAGRSSLWHRRIAATRGTTALEIVDRLQREQEVEPVIVASDAEGVKLVEAGKVDAFAQDDVLLYGLATASDQKSALAVSGDFLSVEPYAFMLPKDDVALREIVDRTLIELMRTGQLSALYRKWFDTDRLRIPMNVYMQENIQFPSRYGVP